MRFKNLLHKAASRSERLMRFLLGVSSTLETIVQSGYKEPEVIALINRVRRERLMLLTLNEALILHSFTRTQRRLSGCMAEVGVFQGGSAKIMCEAKGQTPLHLFDTFEGMPPPGDDDRWFRERDCATSFEAARAYLSDYGQVWFHKGMFPDTATPVADEMFSLVHLDVDLYHSTLACLQFFYPRMVQGGVILSHDYTYGEGVRRAFTEFFEDRRELVLELTNSQCMIVKR